MQPSPNCLKLVEASEGCRLRSYRDTGNVWTIGYGHTGGVRENQVITQAVAEQLLQHDMEYATSVVNSHAGTCSQNQFDALVDFVFNVGPSQFLHSTLLKYHLNGEYDKAAAEFPKWKYDNGKVINGLVARREAEKFLYTHQVPSEDRPHTDELEHSVSSEPYPDPVESPVVDSQPSLVQPVPVSHTAPESDNTPSGLVSQVCEMFHKLLEAIRAQREDT